MEGGGGMMIIWIFLCVLVGYCADKKGRNGWAWGIASLFLTPLVIGITLALTPDEKDEKAQTSFSSNGGEDSDDEKRCPECGYLADAGEQYCPRCGEMLW